MMSSLNTGVTPGQSNGFSAQSYMFLQRFIHNESGIFLDKDKQYLLEARLRPLMAEHKIESLDKLTTLLASRSAAGLGRLVVDAMTTNETLFFRDAQLFEALRTQVLPKRLALIGKQRKLRIWSAAASTGQEAYSIAMTLRELGYTSRDAEIFGTDISPRVLERAKKGQYMQCEVDRGLSPALLSKYFTRAGVEWQLKNEIREMVTFQEWDLRRDSQALGSFDLIFCRNVLIYFDQETKIQVLRSLTSRLEPGGSMILGCAETIINLSVGLVRSPVGTVTLYSKL